MSNVDYSKLLHAAIGSGASKDEVQHLLEQREAKIDASGGGLEQYRHDATYNKAMAYIDELNNQEFNAKRTSPSGSSGGTDLSDYLRQQFTAKTEAELANLKAAYEKSMRGYEDTAKQLPKTYGAAKNSVAAQNAIAKKNFAERAAASGLNSGTSGQADLALSSAYLSEIAGLEEAQAGAQSDIELQKADLQTEYERAIAAAKATGDAELANALYNELLRVQTQQREDARVEAANKQAQLEWAAQEKNTAYNQAMGLIKAGYTPSTDLLTAAGLGGLQLQLTAPAAPAAPTPTPTPEPEPEPELIPTSGMNADYFRAFGQSVAAQMGANQVNAALGNIDSRWAELNEAQREQVQTMLMSKFGYKYTP